jgi:four helix bundle protein
MTLRANAGRLLVHRVASEIAKDCFTLATTFTGPGAHTRGDQLVRAALSICSNIAEACGRGTVPEFRQFLRYARGSAHELRTHVRIAREYDPARVAQCRTLESRTTLVIKLLMRLHDSPPPDR